MNKKHLTYKKRPILKSLASYITLIVWMVLAHQINAQEESSFSDIPIKVKDIEDKNVREIFTILSDTYDLKIAFQEGDSTFYEPVVLPDTKSITLENLLKVLEKNIPYEVIHKKGYIIFQKKKLQKKYQLKGRIYDSGTQTQLVAATVYIQQNGAGSLTDDQGAFSFSLPPGSYDVVVKFMGYNDRFLHVNLYDDQELSFKLQENIFSINEINVTSERTYANNFEVGRTVEKIDSKEIGKVTSGNVLDALHARIPGVWATKVSGAPGDHMKIRIRGINSINGSVDPLYIVDGVPIPKVNFNSLGISDLNSSDIENMTILKDAASSAIYGFQGGNGVVIIDTKTPGGKPTFTVQQKTGVQFFNKQRYNLEGTYPFLQNYMLADENLGTHYYGGNSTPPKYKFSLPQTDWQEEIFRTGLMKEYQLNANGSIKGFKYYVSGANYKHDGIIESSNYQKNNLLAHLCYSIKDKCNISVNYRGAAEENKNNMDTYMGNPVIFQGINTAPYYNNEANGYYTMPNEFDKYDLLYAQDDILHPGGAPALLNDYKRIQKINSNSLVLSANYEVLKNLVVSTSGSISRKDYKYAYEMLKKQSNNQGDGYYITNHEAYGDLYSTDQVNFINYNADITYNVTKGLHQLKLLGGYRDYKDNIYWRIDSTKFDSYVLEEKAELYPRGSMIIYNDRGSMIRSLRSGYFHTNYNYNKKYTVSLAGNYSALYEMDKYITSEFFPSVALNWDMSKEFWLADVKRISSFNIYVNWGKVGNFPLNGLANDLYSTRQYSSNASFSDERYLNNLGNHYLTHEVMTEINLGSKISLFNERLTLGADCYNKVNDDLMLIREIPMYYGGGRMMINAGAMHSSGIELSIEAIPVQTKNFSWYLKGSYSSNNQYITKLDTALYFYNEADYVPDFIVSEDMPLGTILGYEFVDFYDEENEYHQQLIEEGKVFAEQGAIYVNDTLALSKEENIAAVGNSLPDFTFSLDNSFRFKNFQLDMQWYCVSGVEKYNATKASTYMSGVNKAINDAMHDGYLSGKDYYRSSTFYNSSYFVEDASFIRLKKVSLSYAPKKKWFKYVMPEFTLTLENLLTLTKYSGYDPEASIYTDNNFSDNALDKGAYPLPKTIHFAVKLTL